MGVQKNWFVSKLAITRSDIEPLFFHYKYLLQSLLQDFEGIRTSSDSCRHSSSGPNYSQVEEDSSTNPGVLVLQTLKHALDEAEELRLSSWNCFTSAFKSLKDFVGVPSLSGLINIITCIELRLLCRVCSVSAKFTKTMVDLAVAKIPSIGAQASQRFWRAFLNNLAHMVGIYQILVCCNVPNTGEFWIVPADIMKDVEERITEGKTITWPTEVSDRFDRPLEEGPLHGEDFEKIVRLKFVLCDYPMKDVIASPRQISKERGVVLYRFDGTVLEELRWVAFEHAFPLKSITDALLPSVSVFDMRINHIKQIWHAKPLSCDIEHSEQSSSECRFIYNEIRTLAGDIINAADALDAYLLEPKLISIECQLMQTAYAIGNSSQWRNEADQVPESIYNESDVFSVYKREAVKEMRCLVSEKAISCPRNVFIGRMPRHEPTIYGSKHSPPGREADFSFAEHPLVTAEEDLFYSHLQNVAASSHDGDIRSLLESHDAVLQLRRALSIGRNQCYDFILETFHVLLPCPGRVVCDRKSLACIKSSLESIETQLVQSEWHLRNGDGSLLAGKFRDLINRIDAGNPTSPCYDAFKTLSKELSPLLVELYRATRSNPDSGGVDSDGFAAEGEAESQRRGCPFCC